MRGSVEEILSGLLGAKVRCRLKTVEQFPAAPPVAIEKAIEKPPAQPDPKPDSKLHSKPDSTVVNSVLELFEGRLLPGEG
jgi:hypothetical protein